jgi:hypothetical protein
VEIEFENSYHPNFSPSHLYREEIVASKNHKFRVLFVPLSSSGDESYMRVWVKVKGSKAHNWHFLYRHGAECTENSINNIVMGLGDWIAIWIGNCYY